MRVNGAIVFDEMLQYLFATLEKNQLIAITAANSQIAYFGDFSAFSFHFQKLMAGASVNNRHSPSICVHIEDESMQNIQKSHLNARRIKTRRFLFTSSTFSAAVVPFHLFSSDFFYSSGSVSFF